MLSFCKVPVLGTKEFLPLPNLPLLQTPDSQSPDAGHRAPEPATRLSGVKI